MKLIEQIETGQKPGPRRVMMFGTQGIGKSTWASMAPSPIFIQTEDGLGGIDCAKFPIAKSFKDVMAAVGELYTEPHNFETVVIDSLDWLETLIWESMCKRKGVKNVEDIGYSKGYAFVLDEWREFLDGLTALRNERGMMSILLAHSKIEKFENPETESYDRFTPRLHKHAAAVIQEWADEVLFASYKIHTRTTDEGFNRKRTQGISSGERIIRTTERPAHVAKNRLNLPDEIPLDWASYAEYLPTIVKGGKGNGESQL